MKTLDMSKYQDWKDYVDDDKCEEGEGCTGCIYRESCERFVKVREIELGEDQN